MAFRSRTVLSRCSTKPLPKPSSAAAAAANGINEDPANPTVEVTGHPSDDDGDIVPMKKKKKKKKKEKEEEERNSTKQNSTASTSASSSSSSRPQHEQREQPTGFRIGSRRRWRRGPGASRCVGEAEQVQDLGLPLGMSVAVVMSEVLERQNTSELIPTARLSKICSLAVKESIANVYGDRFDRFVTNFESSFHSTLNTLRSISGAMSHEQNSPPSTSCVENVGIEDRPTRSSSKHVRTTMEFSASTSCTENLGSEDCLIPVSSRNTTPEEVPEHRITGCLDNQISIYGQMSEELSLVSVNHAAPTENISVLERFAAEQARANKLKEVELGLTLEQMELKKMQLNLNYDSNSLTRTKISMGIMDASFRKEKFKNQVEETRNAEFLNKCKDCLVVGLFVMSGCLIYGAKTFAYNKIMEMTEACTAFTKEPKSWWMPKQMDSFSSGLRMLRCHVIAMSRISFGILMILAIGYSIMQRPGTTGSVMPVTYYLLLLGSLCGLAGKFCIETLGGSGYLWLLYWEPLILLHFFTNVNPSAFYNFLYGPVSVSPGDKVVRMPYLIRRIAFYSVVFFSLPVLAGLMPFASPIEWKDHFVILITGSDA